MARNEKKKKFTVLFSGPQIAFGRHALRTVQAFSLEADKHTRLYVGSQWVADSVFCACDWNTTSCAPFCYFLMIQFFLLLGYHFLCSLLLFFLFFLRYRSLLISSTILKVLHTFSALGGSSVATSTRYILLYLN